jgi:hypothetical protein
MDPRAVNPKPCSGGMLLAPALVPRQLGWLPVSNGSVVRGSDLEELHMVTMVIRRWLLSAACLLMVIGLSVSFLAPTASAEDVGTAVGTEEPSFVPRQGIYFNNPAGTRDEQYVLSDQLVKTVDATPPGAVIYLTAYSMTAVQDVDALVRAYRRGVFVRLLIDSHVISDQMIRMRRLLGTDTRKNSYFRTCEFSCMSDRHSYLHSKVATFSTTGGVDFVTMVSSANPASTGVLSSWNNMYRVVGDEALYASNIKYFHDMLADRPQPDYFRTTTSGKLKQYFTPRAKGDTMISVLKRVKCRGAAPGYGTSGWTRIRVGMYAWTNLRTNIAERLNTLKAQGCDIQVVYTGDKVHNAVTKALLKKTKKGRIKVYNGRLDRDNDGVLETYVHHKFLSINGVYKGKPNSAVVFTGSTNFTLNTIRSNNDVVLMIDDRNVLHQFEMNFRLIRDNWTKPIRSYTAAKAMMRRLNNARVVNEDGQVVRVGSRQHRLDMNLG